MARVPPPFSPNRRGFLLGAGSALAVATPMAQAASLLWPERALRVGVVMAPSLRLPGLSTQLAAGFQSYLAASNGRAGGQRIEMISLACECGPRSSMQVATRAVESGSVDLLLGMVNRNHAAQLRPLLERTGTPFIVTDVGADIVRERKDGAFLIRNSLGYWQANHAMGAWARANLGARVLIATDFLESGYDMVHAFRRAFEASGGEVAGVEVTGLPNGQGTFADVARAAREQRPDFVYALYSGHRAAAFLRFYDSEGLARSVPLAGPGLLTDSIAADELPRGLEGLVTAAGWDAGVDPFAALGYETAQRIDVALSVLQGNDTNRHALAAELARASFDGPRGRIASLEGMAESSMPTFIRRLASTPRGLANVSSSVLPAISPSAALRAELRTAVKTGWLQAYLAA